MSLGPERTAAVKAHYSHPTPLLGIKLVDPAISLAFLCLGGPATHAPTPLIRAGSVIGRPGQLPQD
jgi:hypothetical protein